MRPAKVSATPAAWRGMMCVYTRSVIAGSAWPSRSATTCTGMPASRSAVAWICRRSRKRAWGSLEAAGAYLSMRALVDTDVWPVPRRGSLRPSLRASSPSRFAVATRALTRFDSGLRQQLRGPGENGRRNSSAKVTEHDRMACRVRVYLLAAFSASSRRKDGSRPAPKS